MVSRSCGNSALYWFSLAERRAPWQSAVLKVVSELTPQWLQVPELKGSIFSDFPPFKQSASGGF